MAQTPPPQAQPVQPVVPGSRPVPQEGSPKVPAGVPNPQTTNAVPMPTAIETGVPAYSPTTRSPTQAGRPDRPARSAAPTGAGALQGDNFRTFMLRLDRQCQSLLDRVAPFKLYRWLGLCAVLLIFLIRMFYVEGFYIVAYVLFIFILNQFILFLQPKDRAALVAKATTAATESSEDLAQEREALPTLDDEEFRPFVRRLPEFKFWYSTSYATVLAFCATFFDAFDVPVFWPLLLFYFIVLFVATMRRQWLDMKKLKYVPWDIGSKKVYKSDPKRVSVATRPQSNAPHEAGAANRAAAPPVPTIQVGQKKAPSLHTPPAQPAQA